MKQSFERNGNSISLFVSTPRNTQKDPALGVSKYTVLSLFSLPAVLNFTWIPTDHNVGHGPMTWQRQFYPHSPSQELASRLSAWLWRSWKEASFFLLCQSVCSAVSKWEWDSLVRKQTITELPPGSSEFQFSQDSVKIRHSYTLELKDWLTPPAKLTLPSSHWERQDERYSSSFGETVDKRGTGVGHAVWGKKDHFFWSHYS